MPFLDYQLDQLKIQTTKSHIGRNVAKRDLN